ncbi:MAG: CRTAC1 family protein [Acidobacteria bacterium]|nr:CRTAC1 family protein [Acidobacteriota bacterium]
MRILLLLAAAGALCAQPARFTDVTRQAGIRFTHNANKGGKKFLPETMGSGCAFADLDGDGWPDIVLVNPRPAIYRNNHDGTFSDVSAAAGLTPLGAFPMGVAAGDYDNDGRIDLYFTALDGDRLFHNEGAFRFKDATKASGIANAAFGTSAAWLDYDRDGRLDLFVANYVQWSRDKDLFCSLDGVAKSYCTPESYKGVSSRLFHNLGDGRFEDATSKAKLADPSSKSLGVTVLDFNQDGWPDLFIANDTQPNKLYRNLKNGTFAEEAVAAGVAFGEDGVARGAMGVDAADYDRTGRPHLLVGNFANQMLGLYHNEGAGLFVDEAPRSAVGRASLLSLAFGVFFFDYDLDGWLDIFSANGHIEDDIARVQPKVKFAQPPLVFRNLSKGRFEDVSTKLGGDLSKPIVARGAAYADFDRDGDLDVLISANNGPAVLYRNDANPAKNNWLNLRLKGVKSNRDAIGAVVRVESASGRQWRTVHTGSSYCSQSDLALTFGLARDPQANIEIDWPSGARQRLNAVKANQHLVIEEYKQP